MQLDFFVLTLNQVQDNMAAILAETLAIAKPLSAVLVKTLHHRVAVVDSAVRAVVLGKGGPVIGLNVCILVYTGVSIGVNRGDA